MISTVFRDPICLAHLKCFDLKFIWTNFHEFLWNIVIKDVHFYLSFELIKAFFVK